MPVFSWKGTAGQIVLAFASIAISPTLPRPPPTASTWPVQLVSRPLRLPITLLSGMGLHNLAPVEIGALQPLDSGRLLPQDGSYLAGVGVAARKAGIPNGSGPAALE